MSIHFIGVDPKRAKLIGKRIDGSHFAGCPKSLQANLCETAANRCRSADASTTKMMLQPLPLNVLLLQIELSSSARRRATNGGEVTCRGRKPFSLDVPDTALVVHFQKACLWFLNSERPRLPSGDSIQTFCTLNSSVILENQDTFCSLCTDVEWIISAFLQSPRLRCCSIEGYFCSAAGRGKDPAGNSFRP